MALDPSVVGRSYPPHRYEVGRAKIAEFADAIGDPSPLYRDRAAAEAAGHPDVIAPPTFATIVTIGAMQDVFDDAELGLDYSRMVHGDQAFEYHRHIRAGDDLSVTAHIEDIMSRAGNDFLTVRADVRTADGEPVVTGRAQLVVRG